MSEIATRRQWAANTLARFATGLGPTLLFGFAAHIAVAIVGMLAIPFYLALMGPEAYGVVGFYLVLQSWMLLFDLGVGPAIGRQLSRYRAGALEVDEVVSLFGAAETLFLIGGTLAGTVFFFSMGWAARHWLGPSHLPPGQLDAALRIAAWLLVLRWLAGVYQTALIGLERQVATNVVALVGAIVRNAGAVLALVFISRSPAVFFAVWGGVTLLEACANRALLWKAMPRTSTPWRPRWRLLTREFSFAAGLTFSTAINFAIGQADKATLSHTLTLGEFGLFSLVTSICAGLNLVCQPMVQAFQPRLTSLMAQGRRGEFVAVYRLSISLVIVVVMGLAGTIAARPDLVIYAWTGDRQIAHSLVATLTLFALGSGISSFLFLPLVLQYAHGFMRLQMIGNVLFGVVWVPAAVWASLRFGTVGAGAVWLCGNLLFLVLWVPVVHARLLSSAERRGLTLDGWLRVGLLSGLLATTRFIPADRLDRLAAFVLLAAISAGVMAAATVMSRDLRNHLLVMIGISPGR